MNPSEIHPLASNASIKFKVKAGQQLTVSCGDMITDSDGDDSGLWCVPHFVGTSVDVCLPMHE